MVDKYLCHNLKKIDIHFLIKEKSKGNPMIHISNGTNKEVFPQEVWYKLKTTILDATCAMLRDSWQPMTYFNNVANERADLRHMAHEMTTKIYDSDFQKLQMFRQHCKLLNLENAMCSHEINGLYILCHKSDDGGVYTPGNSTDICQLLSNIEQQVLEDDQDMWEMIYGNHGILNIFAISSALQRQIIVE